LETPSLAAGDRSSESQVSPRDVFNGCYVSDTSLFDFGYLGRLGLVPGWPGEAVYPPQPMVGQMRALLERYAAHGGRFREEVLADTGHCPHLEKPREFERLLFSFLLEHTR
jgi:pimeloyl-ACP methyl ester carboxylesterase